jgi:predicted RNase H-like HicB family nuclease
MNAHYSFLIQWSEEDQVYIASLPELGPYALTHGSTYEEALRNGQEALGLLMEETMPLPRPQTFDLTHRKVAWHRVQERARATDVALVGRLRTGAR